MTRNGSKEIIPAKQNRFNKKHAGGMPKFEPTEEQRKTVERATGVGLPQETICQLIVSERTGKPIDVETLEKHFRFELDRGAAVANYMVLGTLYDKAINGDTTAAIWWSKARCRWRETREVEVTNKFEGMSDTQLLEHLQRQANELGIKIDLSYRIAGE